MRRLGLLSAPDDLIDAVAASGLSWLPISPGTAYRAGQLPTHHRDPFDRLPIAQAQDRGAALISRDTVFNHYGAP